MNYFFHFFDLLYLNYSFNYFVNSHNFWYLNYSLYNLFYDLLNFNYFGRYSKHFQDIININHVHNLSLYHANHTFVNLENNARFDFDFLELL